MPEASPTLDRTKLGAKGDKRPLSPGRAKQKPYDPAKFRVGNCYGCQKYRIACIANCSRCHL